MRLQSVSVVGTSALPAYRRQEKSGITHPSEIATFSCHFRADSLLLTSGASVSLWNDDFGRDGAVQATGANQPTFQTNQINGWPTVRFDGTNSFMIGFEKNKLVQHIFAVVTSTEDPFTEFRGIVTGTLAGEQGPIAGGSGTSLYTGDGNADIFVDGSAAETGDLVTPLNPHIISWDYNTQRIYTAGIQLGQDRANTSRRWYGDIAEIVCYSSALSAANRNLVFAYLNDKYQAY